MAHKKAAGSTRLGRDSQAKRLGIKIYGNQPARSGQIIVRQRGLQYHPGVNVRRAGDDTLYATADGLAHYRARKVQEFTGRLVSRRFVDVVTNASGVIPDRMATTGRQSGSRIQSDGKKSGSSIRSSRQGGIPVKDDKVKEKVE